MKLSFRWLARHVDLSGLTPAEVANDLTIHTAEVEGLAPFAPWLAEVVVGHVVERAKHPDADKLSVCKVDVGPRGEGQLLQIVCGAANVAQGQRVAVALPGVTLPGELKIKKSKIRGVESAGMICSERELELSDDHAGIWVLAGTPALGTSVAAALGADDHVIEIDNKSLTHRPDCWGHRGIAREIAAIRGRKLRALDLALPRTEAGAAYPVRVTSAGCFRYLGLPITGVTNGRSPDWLRFLLLAVGQRPLDLAVDLSNFVMLDLAQPNHLFDLRRLGADGIEVRDARPGEKTHTLDGVERTLTGEDMLICSGGAPVAIAGVMGGEASKVQADTSELLLEVASFHPTRVRRTAARLGLRTDASARFEKNLDPTLPAQAAAHLVNLLRELQPGIRLPRPAGDAGSWKDPAATIALRPARVRSVLGKALTDAEIEGYLTALELPVTKGERWSVAIPSARATKDLRIEEDLIEEVGRMHGYGNVAEAPLRVELAPAPRDDRRALVRQLQDHLSGAPAFHEAMSYSFLEAGLVQRLGLEDLEHVRIVNPQIEGLDRVRRSLAPSLLGHLSHNRPHRSDVRLFEIGKGYEPEHVSERGEPRERHECTLVWLGPRSWASDGFDKSVFMQLKKVVEGVLEVVGRPVTAWEPCSSTEIEPWAVESRSPRTTWMHPTRAILSRHGESRKSAVRLSALEPEIQRRLGLVGDSDGDVAVAQVSLDALLEIPTVATKFRPIPRYPATKVDIAVAVPEALPVGEILKALNAGFVADFETNKVFDVFRGPSVGPGKKSVAIHIALQNRDSTLSEKDVARYLSKVEAAVRALGGELRKE